MDDVLGQAKAGVREMNKQSQTQQSTPDSKKSAGAK
jgi:hypothetical protein